MRTMCFGGSFNPIHHGHLLCAQRVAERAGYDRVLFIPNGVSPHREGKPGLASPIDRLTMCQLAVKGVPQFDVSDVEVRRPTPSYTLLTARELRQAGWGEVDWLIGGDSVPSLPSWHQAETLVREVRFVVMERPGHAVDWDRLPDAYRSLRQNVVPAPLFDMSSTEVRARVKGGLAVDYFVPPTVGAYIREKGLYRS